MEKEFVTFNYFCHYAQFILDNHLDAFVNAYIDRLFKLNVPLLKLFEQLSREQLFELSKKWFIKYFNDIIHNEALNAAIEEMENWKADKLEGIPREKVVSSDLVLIYNVRKHSLFSFLPHYVTDQKMTLQIIEEIENYYTFLEGLAFSTFTTIQQEEIQKRENQLLEAQAIAHLGSWEWDTQSNSVIWSDEMYRLFGYEPNEIDITYEIYMTHIHPEDKELLIESINNCYTKQIPYAFEKRIIKKNGEIRWLHAKGKVSQVDGDKVLKLSGIGMDITDEKNSADLIKKSEKLLLETQEIANIGSYEWNVVNDTSIISPQVIKIFGYNGDEKVNYHEFEKIIHPEDHEMVSNEVNQSIKTGKIYLAEYRIFRKNDNKLRHIWTKGKIMYDEKGSSERMVGLIMDITERKLIEETLHRGKLELEASNKELEAFCYTISHDLRSPLRAIDGFGKMLDNKYGQNLDKEGKRLLKVVRDNAQQMGILIDCLLDFSRINRKQKKDSKIQMRALVEKVIKNCREQNPEINASFEINHLVDSKADADLIRLVWHNLISNAIKFSSKVENPTVIISSKRLKNTILYEVNDNGAGFDMEYKDKLFGVFQRLHATHEFEGTGVGLATVQRIIHRHGGEVWAKGDKGKGATFSFSLMDKEN